MSDCNYAEMELVETNAANREKLYRCPFDSCKAIKAKGTKMSRHLKTHETKSREVKQIVKTDRRSKVKIANDAHQKAIAIKDANYEELKK